MANTGRLVIVTLEEFYIDDNSPTGVTKPNVLGDPDYVTPYENLGTCPLSNNPLPPQTYLNVAMSQIFIRNNCPSGFTGSEVTYTVPAGTYSYAAPAGMQPSEGQRQANMKALADINQNGQAFANAGGSCTANSIFTFDVSGYSDSFSNSGYPVTRTIYIQNTGSIAGLVNVVIQSYQENGNTNDYYDGVTPGSTTLTNQTINRQYSIAAGAQQIIQITIGVSTLSPDNYTSGYVQVSIMSGAYGTGTYSSATVEASRDPN